MAQEGWRKKDGIGGVFSPSHCSGAIYGWSGDAVYTQYLTAIRSSTGEEIWRHEASWPPIFSGEMMYSGYSRSGTYSDGTFIIAVNVRTGERLWTFTITEPPYGGPPGNFPLPLAVDLDGTVYVGHTSENRIYWLNPSTGIPVGSYEVLSWPGNSPAIAVYDGIVYLPTGRDLYALDSSANELLWRTKYVSGYAPRVANGIVYLHSPQGITAVKAEPPR